MVRKRALFETDIRIKWCGSACRKVRVANRGCHGGKDMRNNDMDGCLRCRGNQRWRGQTAGIKKRRKGHSATLPPDMILMI